MKEYTIIRKTDWDNVPRLSIDHKEVMDFDEDIRAWAQVCYDDEYLYVRLSAYEKNIRAEQTGRFDMPCYDSCLEFFFSPDNNSLKYFNIEMNPNCSMFLGIGTNIEDLIRLDQLRKNGKFSFNPSVEYTEDGWVLTYSIPYSFIRFFFPNFNPKSGDTMRANAFKCGDKCVTPHYLSWNPVDPTVKNSFHNPHAFGLMKFA
ncbi:MAG: carbohydrate-binding family 9-like protein [Eubacteriales bacterium]|nr:carbohydrate-binding family 9-like protein [Eubacteriales bacterium]